MSDLHSQKTGLIVRRRSTEQEQILRQLTAENAVGEEIRAAEYEKIANITGLYRHTISGRYYGPRNCTVNAEKCHCAPPIGKLQNATPRWIMNLHRVDREKERTTFSQLIATFVATNRGESQSTRTTHASIIKRLRQTWRFGWEMEVRDIRPSHLEEWLALHEARLRNTSYNRYAGCLKQMFDIAVKDRIIAESPFVQVKTGWKEATDADTTYSHCGAISATRDVNSPATFYRSREGQR